MNLSKSDQFKNTPRSGAAIRQRSHSTKELATMLQQLQLSVQLMPLSNSHHQSMKQQSNLASTSEEESDSMNSNEASTGSEDDFEEDDYEFDTNLNGLKNYENNLTLNQRNATRHQATSRSSPQNQRKQFQLNNSFTTGLVYPKNLKKLRRSNSLSALTNLSKQKQPDYYCDYDEDNEFDFNNRLTNDHSKMKTKRKNNSFRSTLTRIRYSSSLKDLSQNQYDDELDVMNRYESFNLFSLTNYSMKDKSSSSSINRISNSRLRKENSIDSRNYSTTSIQSINKQTKFNIKNSKQNSTTSLRLDDFNSSNLSNKVKSSKESKQSDDNHISVGNGDYIRSKERNYREEKSFDDQVKYKSLYKSQNTPYSKAIVDLTNSTASTNVWLNGSGDDDGKNFNQFNHIQPTLVSVNGNSELNGKIQASNDLIIEKLNGSAASSDDQLESTSPDINNKVIVKEESVSSCRKRSVEYSLKVNEIENFNFELKQQITNDLQFNDHQSIEQSLNETTSESIICSKGKQPYICDVNKDIDEVLVKEKFCLESDSSSKDQQDRQAKVFLHSSESTDEQRSKNCSSSFTTYQFLNGSVSFDQTNDEQLNKSSTKLNESSVSLNSNNFNLDEPKTGLKNCDSKSNDELNDLNDLNFLKKVLLNKPKLLNLSDYKPKTSIKTKLDQLKLKSDLPIVEEEEILKYPNQSALDSIKMQTLAESQYNQLSYHIAALSCVCDNNNKNLNSYSPFNTSSTNQLSSVDSSPNSSEYSSPYSSPPSSPSSTSSYSSAEEDCSILTNGLNKNLSGSNQSLADLITVNNERLKQQQNTDEQSNGTDVVDCVPQFHSNHRHQGLLTAAANNLSKFNDLDDSSSNSDKDEMTNDGSQLDSESTNNNNQSNNNENDQLINEKTNQQNSNGQLNTLSSTNAKQQVRVRKTSILRNQTPDLSNHCKKEVKFADTLGFALERIKYFPPQSPQVKPKRHSVNLATLHRDYYDESQELFILHSRPQTQDNHILAKQFEERSALYNKQQSKLNLNLNTNIFGNQSQAQNRSGTFSPPHHSSNNFWASYSSNYQPFSPMRDEYCGDMFHQTFDTTQTSHCNSTNKTIVNKSSKIKSNSIGSIQSSNLITNNYPQSIVNYKTSNSLEFNGLNFMNNQIINSFTNQSVSFLPLNFGQPVIQSDFPNRLRSQSVLLHSLDVVGNTVNGIVSVMNLTFEKKVIIKYTINKWATEKHCEAKYSKKDCDNSDKFVFQLTLKETDFPQFQLNEDRTMMFAIRYETGDGRIYWDNNYGQDYRLKCKFN